ncbi:MAG: MBL fold metallo-hydrolase [Deltaproteobacteria bacterium]|nr:MBL fold metallo-hydrolase [Deltaproteobacteria bacterium]
MIEDVYKNISWLGHDGILYQNKKTIYFDPFQIAGGPAADIILISHDHFDHCSPDDVKKIQTKDTVIVTEADSAKKLSGKIEVLKPGETKIIQDITIEAVPSYNTNKDFHVKAKGWLGFVVTLEGVRVYHPGDTDLIPEMKDIKADIAFLPVSGTYVMGPQEAVEAAKVLRQNLCRLTQRHGGRSNFTKEKLILFKNPRDQGVKVSR